MIVTAQRAGLDGSWGPRASVCPPWLQVMWNIRTVPASGGGEAWCMRPMGGGACALGAGALFLGLIN